MKPRTLDGIGVYLALVVGVAALYAAPAEWKAFAAVGLLAIVVVTPAVGRRR